MGAPPGRGFPTLFLLGAALLAGLAPLHGQIFFCQDNLVGSRLLAFTRDGSYRQIDVDRVASVETDRGTWERDVHGAFLLHPLCAGLRFRALSSGPLTIVLDRPGALAALPGLAEGMRRFLSTSEDAVFGRGATAEMGWGEVLSISAQAETFSRAEVLSLLGQIDDLLWSDGHNTYILSPVPKTSPQLLVLQDARWQAEDLPRVRQQYGVAPGAAPPFYFARVDTGTFARRAGRWKVLVLPGRPN